MGPTEMEATSEAIFDGHFSRLAQELRRPKEAILGEAVEGELGQAPIPFSSVLSATIQRQNTAVQGLRQFARAVNRAGNEPTPNFNPLERVPFSYLDHADLYANDKSDADIAETTAEIERSLKLKSIVEQAPWYQDVPASFVSDLLDPINAVFPGSLAASRAEQLAAFLATTPRAQAVVKGAAVGALTAVGSTTLQETALQSLDATREADESVYNMIGATVLGAALGGAVGSFAKGSPLEQAAVKDIQDIYQGGTVFPTPGSAVGAKPVQDAALLKEGESLADLPDWVKKAQLTPYYKMVNSDFLASKALSNQLNQTHQFLGKNVGVTRVDERTGLPVTELVSPTEIAVEEHMRADQRHLLKQSYRYEEVRLRQQGIHRGPLKNFRASRSETGLTNAEYDAEVVQGMINGYYHPDKDVQAGIDILKETLERYSEKAKELGLLGEDIGTPRNAQSYWPIVYNLQKINENPKAFHDFLFQEFKQTNEEIKSLSPELEKIRQELKAQGLKETELELELAKRVPAYLRTSEGKVRPILSDDDFIQMQATQTLDNIRGDNETRLQNPILRDFSQGAKNTRHLKARSNMIPHERLLPWTLQDPMLVINYYVKGLSPIVRLTERAKALGHDSIEAWQAAVKTELKKEYEAKQVATPEGKASDALYKAYQEQQRLVDTSFKIQQGIYGAGENVFSAGYAQFAKRANEWNYMRLLGFVLPSSLPDVGALSLRNGVFKTIATPLKLAMQNFESIKQNKELLKSLNFALNVQTGQLQKSFMDNEGLTNQVGVFGKAWDRAVQSFGNVSLVNYWDDFWQTVAGIDSISRTLSTIDKWMTGKPVPEQELVRLRSLHIGETEAAFIHAQWKRPGVGGKDDGGYWTDFAQWNMATKDELKYGEAFQFAIAKDIEWSKVVPTQQDKTLAHYNPTGRLILALKSYAFAMTNKVLLSGIQRRAELELYTGAMMSLSLGALSYVTTSYLRGKEPDFSFENLSKEAVDRSGLLGILMEPYNILGKIQALPWQATSRYQSRGKIGALLGPTYGLADDVLELFQTVATANGGKKLSRSDVNRIIRLMPYQNLFYLYRLNQIVGHGAARALTLEQR